MTRCDDTAMTVWLNFLLPFGYSSKMINDNLIFCLVSNTKCAAACNQFY